tara:strand:- start:11714 stop:12142 length:429 start_codon:yes stop_codon:yes gene_type:complete
MELALREAKQAVLEDEVPVGCIIVRDNNVIASARNSCIQSNSPIRHAEINAIEQACDFLSNYRLNNCDLYVTLEPCHMCCMAIVHARIRNVYFALLDEKTGAVISNGKFFDKNFLNHQVSYDYGMYAEESKKLLQDFFQQKR